MPNSKNKPNKTTFRASCQRCKHVDVHSYIEPCTSCTSQKEHCNFEPKNFRTMVLMAAADVILY